MCKCLSCTYLHLFFSAPDESYETTSFLTLLSTWDKQELEQRLGQRVEFSKRAIGKLLQAFDRILQRNEKMHQAMADRVEQQVGDVPVHVCVLAVWYTVWYCGGP